MDTQAFLFESWTSLARTFVVGVLAYVTLLTLLRVVGKHSLAKLNAYGLVITVALGSMLASALLTKQVTLADGIAAIGLLLALQFLFSTVVSRSARAAQYLTATPTLLLWHGRLLEDQIRRERVTVAEIRAAIRQSGSAQLADVAAVVLETDGSLSVVGQASASDWAFADVVPAPCSVTISHELARQPGAGRRVRHEQASRAAVPRRPAT
jgi:uncharacterized membrane protein YcaP (DUF421 family)